MRLIHYWCRVALCVVILLLSGNASISAQSAAGSCSFKNPIIAKGQDPSVVFHNGFYYLVQSDVNVIYMRQSATLTGLGNATNNAIFTAPPGQPYSTDIWAPELAVIDGKGYIYFAANDTPGNNAAHRMFVLQADTPDLSGKWTYKGAVYKDAATDKWAIDAVVFPIKGKLYMMWSGAPDDGTAFDSPQSLFIAPMDDPLTVTTPRRLISTPTEAWERSVRPIQEGPQPFIYNGVVSIVYSADASWTAAYKLGVLTLTGDDPLVATSWKKSSTEFAAVKTADGSVYGPGHNSSPVISPDGSQFWLVYHAKALAQDGWTDREIAMRPFAWNADNTPNISTPVPATVALPLPAGEPCGLRSTWTFDGELTDDKGTKATPKGSPAQIDGKSGKAFRFNGTSDYLDIDAALLNTTGSYTISVWVNLTNADQPGTIISQEGGIASQFALQYTAEKRFVFSLFNTRGDPLVSAVSIAQPAPGEWVQLIAVRDALAKEIRLYVNGKLQETKPFNEDWSAKGHTIIGAARQKTQRVEYFSGSVDEVRFYNSALTESEVQGF